MAAGSETSANTISFALHYLSTNPETAAKAHAEIDQHWPGSDFPNIEFDDIAKLRYLRRVVDETLRLWPVAPGYYRQARRDTTLGNGKYHFEKGIVAVVLLAAHRAPPGFGCRQIQPRPVPTREFARAAPAHLQALRHRPSGLHRSPIRTTRDRVDTGRDPAPI